MKRIGWLISRYLLGAIVPYFVFSWLLLSVILFVQQAGSFYNIFFSVNIPAHLVWQLTLALIPNVIAFTCPAAVLVGTIIGLSKMQGDSELVAIRAAGVGDLQIVVPIVVLGIGLSIFAFLVNIKGVPIAATLVRSVALQTAIQKLESPIEPGVFNTEIAGYTIYARSGNIATGHWNNLFIYREDPSSGTVRLITSEKGRIDLTDQASELVLENAIVSTLPRVFSTGNYSTENLGEVRLAIKTRRGELIEKLGSKQSTPEELGLGELSDYAQSKEGKDRIEAQILQMRRVILSITPLIFCLLGTAMILRFSRGGRGFGVFLSLIGLIGYFLLAFLGEQMARTGRIPVLIGGALPLVGSAAAIGWLSLSSRVDLVRGWIERFGVRFSSLRRPTARVEARNIFVDLTTGLRDFDLIKNLAKYFFLALGFLSSIFLIFTAFDLWRFAGSMDGGVWLLLKYLFFLLPFIYLQISPSAAMVATLATYVIKSRQNEIVTWTSAGQSVYRLLVPCFISMLLLGFANWGIQERVSPGSNRLQDEYRAQIRTGGALTSTAGKYWVASDDRIYSFQLASDNERLAAKVVGPTEGNLTGTDSANASASDNEKQVPCSSSCIRNLTIYQFANGRSSLQTVYRTNSASWSGGKIAFYGVAEKSVLTEGKISSETINFGEFAESNNPFDQLGGKPSHMTAAEIRREIETRDSEAERRSFTVALEKRFSTIFLPLVIALFTAPFALSIHRSGKVVTVGYAVGLWLLYTGATNLFEQFGQSGFLSPSVAVWSPAVIFSMLGLFLISKIRT